MSTLSTMRPACTRRQLPMSRALKRSTMRCELFMMYSVGFRPNFLPYKEKGGSQSEAPYVRYAPVKTQFYVAMTDILSKAFVEPRVLGAFASDRPSLQYSVIEDNGVKKLVIFCRPVGQYGPFGRVLGVSDYIGELGYRIFGGTPGYRISRLPS